MSQYQKLRISQEDWEWVLQYQGDEKTHAEKQRQLRRQYYRMQKQEKELMKKIQKTQKELKIQGFHHHPPTLSSSEVQQRRRIALRQYNDALRAHRSDILVFQKRLHQAIRQENKTTLYAHRDRLRQRLQDLRARIATLRLST